MQRFGRLQQDVENCLRKLVAFGIARRAPGTPAQYEAARPGDSAAPRLLDGFLAEQAVVNHEGRSPAVQRFREMIGSDAFIQVTRAILNIFVFALGLLAVASAAEAYGAPVLVKAVFG